ncbi:hypothetical protein STAS_25342 [Striga asiatica]|uniref:Uncharacterized protein n=1 Tax=Striga asiatica TaxID=4170 RepID=A0A5A7QSJ1_STRAF|nr:hypothetical protein STAS_25342 [Striga asiatica]
MSVIQVSEAMDPSAELQIWNNAAFDNSGGISEDLSASRQSWGSLKSIFGNPKASFDSVSDKENLCVGPENDRIPSLLSSSLKSSSTPFKPVNSDNRAVEEKKSRTGGFLKESPGEKIVALVEIRDEKAIDDEIEEIESHISKLKSKLEALRLEKAEANEKAVEKKIRAVPAKFMNPKKADGTTDKRRGISLGPVEIISGARRVASVGPAEIFRAARSRQMLGRPEMGTPVQNRRKSCYWKLQGIDEEKVGLGFSSVSPNSRKIGLKSEIKNSRQAVTTISSRKAFSKKEDSVLNSVQPKKLFREGGEKVDPTAGKKLSRPGRIVASRYNNLNSVQTPLARKKSLPENDDGFSQKFDSKRALSVGKARVKKRWEIPSEIVVHSSVETEKKKSSPPQSIVLLPKIKTARCMKESPRDSGPAKKVVELIGKKSFFANDSEDEMDPPVCQTLTYDEEEEVEEFSYPGF